MTEPFVHLHVHSDYSLLDGGSKVDRLVDLAAEHDMEALALTDHGVPFGAIDFYKKAKKKGIQPIIGCEVYVAPGDRTVGRRVPGEPCAYHLTLPRRQARGVPRRGRQVGHPRPGTGPPGSGRTVPGPGRENRA